MIQRAYLTAWRNKVPWIDDAQIEQDLVLSRALAEIFANSFLKTHLAFRGGTALHKLFFRPAGRYSEDLDFVRTSSGPVGEIVTQLRKILDPWLGAPKKTKRGEGRFTLLYGFQTELEPIRNMRVKVEINTREHFNLFGLKDVTFDCTNPWFSGRADVTTFSIEELLGTKLRALYQRKKGRDLFDLYLAIATFQDLKFSEIVSAFSQYMERSKLSVTRVEFEKNLLVKRSQESFKKDIGPLLSTSARNSFNFDEAVDIVLDQIIALLPNPESKTQNKKALRAKRKISKTR